MTMPETKSRLAGAREDFPALAQQVNGRPLAYLDNAATTQRPKPVLDAMWAHETHDHANVHRGVHALSVRATRSFDEARRTVQRFLGAEHEEEILFTKGCTEAVNLVASSWGRANLKPGDRVLVSTMEHHADIVPWQIVAAERGATVEPIPISDRGELLLDELERMLDERVRLVGCVHVSNSLGTINPVAEVVRLAHSVGALSLIDGAQALAHTRTSVREIDADFYTLSSHKMYGPTGIGALYGKKSLLEEMPPYQAGGDMIRTVSFRGTTFAGLPNKFEPGTPPITAAIGLAAAIRYIEALGLDAIAAHEHDLLEYATAQLSEIEGLKIWGTAEHKAAIVSFTLQGAHPHDIGTILDSEGVAIRAGHHCCMPLMTRLGIPATARASFALYSTHAEVDQLVAGVRKVKEVLT